MRGIVVLVLGVVFAGAVGAATADLADARPGGGHSFSSGGGGGRSYSGGSYRSSGSGGGGGTAGNLGGAAVAALVIGTIMFVAIVAAAASGTNKSATIASAHAWTPASRATLQPLVARDRSFSQTAFEDFAFQLYARAQRARAKPEALAALTPYLAPNVIEAYEMRSPVSAVVIGSLRMTGVTVDEVAQHARVRIEANLVTERGTVNVIEQWTFTRAPDVTSRHPDKTRTFPCPNCNAPFARGAAERTCAHCGTPIGVGQFDWTVTEAVIGASQNVGITLTGTVEEVGTDLPTRTEPTAHDAFFALSRDDSNISWKPFAARVTMIYQQLNAGWNAQNLAPVRGLVTSALLGYLQFWIDEYKRQALANHLAEAKLHQIELAKVQRDPYFDAVTVRMFADGLDFTLDARGDVVGGSRTKRRSYTEYWTFVRSSTRKGPITTEPTCPNCGAPLAISDAGACTHCNAEVENGSFDWVLSKIEQDEVYTG